MPLQKNSQKISNNNSKRIRTKVDMQRFRLKTKVKNRMNSISEKKIPKITVEDVSNASETIQNMLNAAEQVQRFINDKSSNLPRAPIIHETLESKDNLHVHAAEGKAPISPSFNNYPVVNFLGIDLVNLIKRLRKPSTIISLVSHMTTIFLFVGISVDIDVITGVTATICSALITLGILNNPDTVENGYGDDLLYCRACGRKAIHLNINGRMVCKDCGVPYNEQKFDYGY